MATESLYFSRAKLIALCVSDKRTYYKDADSRALQLAVLPSGTKAFEIYRKFDGKPTRIGLGHFDPTLPESRTFTKGFDPLELLRNTPKLNVLMARLLAAAVNAQLDKGINPSSDKTAAKKAKQAELTLQMAFDKYTAEYLLPHNKKTTVALQNLFARHLGFLELGQKIPHGKQRQKSENGVDWSKRKLSEITSDEVRKLHIAIKDASGLHTANRVFELLRSIYNKMSEWQFFIGINPCLGVSKFKEMERERFLGADEIQRFLTALQNVKSDNFRSLLWLLLLTGARRENVLGMRWSDVDLNVQRWTVQGEFSKNGSPLAIPLSPQAIEVLQDRKDYTEAGQVYVFPANSKSGYMTAPKKQWAAFRKEVGIQDIRLHDLRRTLGSWMAMNNVSLPIIGKMLGHKSEKATSVYAKLQVATVKGAVDSATNSMFEQAGILSPLS